MKGNRLPASCRLPGHWRTGLSGPRDRLNSIAAGAEDGLGTWEFLSHLFTTPVENMKNLELISWKEERTEERRKKSVPSFGICGPGIRVLAFEFACLSSTRRSSSWLTSRTACIPDTKTPSLPSRYKWYFAESCEGGRYYNWHDRGSREVKLRKMSSTKD